MSKALLRILSATAILVSLGLFGAAAQVRLSSSLRGTVTDANGAALAGALLTLTNASTGAERTTTSRDGGEYQFEQLKPGIYRLRIELSGFQTVVREDVRLLVMTGSTLDIELPVGEVGETVKIEAGASPLNTQ